MVVTVTRIIAGAAGGRRLETPRGQHTRPTSDRVREALFSRLDSWDALVESRFLDLYAGSGAIALEAASRGAAHVVAVESGRSVAALIRRNVTVTGLANVDVVGAKVETYLAKSPDDETCFNVAFLDPPYALSESAVANVLSLLANRWLQDAAVVILERSTRSPEPLWPPHWADTSCHRYGQTCLWFARTKAAAVTGRA